VSAGTPYRLAWYGCDLSTGGIIEELPAVAPSGPLARRLGDTTTASLDLALDGAPLGWASSTDPGRTMLVAVDPAIDTPIWAGLVITREGGTANTVQLGAATPERYLDSRFPGDVALFGVDQADVVTALVTPALADGIPLVLDAPDTGTVMDYEVAAADDRTVLSCLQEVMGLEGGPEWTIDPVWADASHTAFSLVLRVRSRIGVQADPPEGTFDAPGCVTAYSLAESYEQGKGATRVTARGEGEGEARLTSAPQDATALLASGWPLWEYRFTPAAGLTDPDQLTAHAAQALAQMATGSSAWTIEAVASQAPRLGVAWALGDNVRLAVARSPRHPAGADVTARCWAWELDPDADAVRPILIQEDT
jgi:hypothetical protein